MRCEHRLLVMTSIVSTCIKCYTFFPVNISNLYHFAIDPLDGNEPLDEFPGFTQVRNVNLVCWNGIIKSDLCFESSIQVLGDIVERSNANETQTVSQPNDFQMTCTQKSDVSTKTEPKKRVSLFKKSRMSWFGDWYDFQSNIRFAPKIISITTVSSWWSKEKNAKNTNGNGRMQPIWNGQHDDRDLCRLLYTQWK